MADEKFVITRPFPSSGLGGNLLSMVGALYLCERTGRNLIVDWTKISELVDPSLNYFTTFFEPIRQWRSVKVYYVNGPDGVDPPVQYDEVEMFRPTPRQYRELLEQPDSRRCIFLQPFHYRILESAPITPAARFHYTREFYDRLTPRPHLQERLASHADRFERNIVVGLNVRTGNGEFGPGSAYHKRINMAIFARDRFLDRLQRACADCFAAFPRDIAAEGRIFVVTDCQSMQDMLLSIPNSFAARRTVGSA